MKVSFMSIAVLSAFIVSSPAAMVITEWMYQGAGGEFIEFTNTGSTAIDLSGWSFDDDSRIPGVFNLSPLGVVQPGQSVIISEFSAIDFRAAWSLSPETLVLGGYTNNLGRADEINLYNGSTLADRLTFGDATIGGPRTAAISGVTSPSNYGANDVTKWVLSSITDGPTVGDGISWRSTVTGDVGSPGIAAIPEPTASALLGLSMFAFGARRKRTK